MTKLRCAVVGVGYLGRFHAQKYMMIPECELVGVCDSSPDRAREIASELQVPQFTDFRQLLGKVDAVTIAASTRTHYEIAKFFLESGVHVNVEKPMTAELKQAEELVVLAEARNLKFQVGHVERFNPALQSAKEKLKKPLFIECHRLAPFKPRGVDVDVVLDLMIHDLDVILSLVKSKVKSVSATGVPVLTEYADIANARIEFESGTIANVTASRVSQSATRKFRVFQNSQYLSVDFGAGEIHLTSKTGAWPLNLTESNLPLTHESWSLEKGDALLAETKSFVGAILNDKPVEVSGLDGMEAMRLAIQIQGDIRARQQLLHEV